MNKDPEQLRQNLTKQQQLDQYGSESKEKQCCHGESVCLKCITEKHNCNPQSLKIDQKFLDKTAKQHNKDYPKEYWNKSIKIDALENVLMRVYRAGNTKNHGAVIIQAKKAIVSIFREIIGETKDEVLPDMHAMPHLWTERNTRNNLRQEQRSRAKALGLDIERGKI